MSSALRHHFWAIFIVFWALLLPPSPICAQTARIAVFYPQVEEPYRSVFQTILRGIELHPEVRASSRAVTESVDLPSLRTWLLSEQAEVVIALGKQGYLAARGASGNLPTLFGALPLGPDGLSGISLAPDPDHLFQSLVNLAPDARRIHVVYSAVNGWVIEQAREAARIRGLTLEAYQVGDLRQAVHQYRTLLQRLQGGKEAIWLPLDNISANDEVVLPMLLQAAWDKNLVLFSSKPSHAQRGALFSMFPDHLALGQSLAQMAVGFRQSADRPGVLPLADLQLAVNLRTAAHLGLRFSRTQQSGFDLVFPSR